MLTWRKREAWVAVFDVLGFVERSRGDGSSFECEFLQELLGVLVGRLDEYVRESGLVGVDRLVMSDTLVLVTASDDVGCYGPLALVCKKLIEESVVIRLPVRGAISRGFVALAAEHPVIVGNAAIEAYEHCVGQNWIGLLLTPSGTRAVCGVGCEPPTNDFVADSIPWSGKGPPVSFEAGLVYAYRFQNGAASYASLLEPWLKEMEHFAPGSAKDKYDYTVAFIERHYRRL